MCLLEAPVPTETISVLRLMLGTAQVHWLDQPEIYGLTLFELKKQHCFDSSCEVLLLI